MFRSFVLAIALSLSGTAFVAAQEAEAPKAPPAAGSKQTSTFGITGPKVGHSPVNANGTPISEKGVTTNVDGKPVNNLSGGTGVNPYTGVPVGQPMHPNDLGSPEAAPRR